MPKNYPEIKINICTAANQYSFTLLSTVMGICLVTFYLYNQFNVNATLKAS